MRAIDLRHEELLELDPLRGLIRVAGQRVLLLDAVAVGLLRHSLVENCGLVAARAVLTQFGFAHGWRLAETMRTAFAWDDDTEWRRAGARVFTLEGLFLMEELRGDPLDAAGASLLASYEADQHLDHFGRADESVCWTIAGLLSGYASRTIGEAIYVLEDRCRASGDATCHLLGRTREQWGEEHAKNLAFFDQKKLDECLTVSLQPVVKTLEKANAKRRVSRTVRVEAAREENDPLGIAAKSPKMMKVVALARRVARVDTTVLLTGESGSGKERIARLVHAESPRAAGPYVAINCGAISDALLDSELFGHKRGAFTGASADRAGLFEAAHGGTLLLDEVGEVSPAMQVKLLRALQEKEVRRVGENTYRAVDVRVLAATNRDLAQAMREGDFREDLYYRLRVVELHVPPLRERPEDILPLARTLLADAAARMARPITGLAPTVAHQLLAHDWPGNVRELANAMEYSAALADGPRIELGDLPEELRETPATPRSNGAIIASLADVEKRYILEVLERNHGNRTTTAAQLGIGSSTLFRRLKRYDE